MSETPTSIRTDSRKIGEHTEEVLGKILGLDANQLADLRSQGAIN